MGSQPDAQFVTETLAKVQSNACGVWDGSSILSGETLFENEGYIALSNADTAICYGQKYMVFFSCGIEV